VCRFVTAHTTLRPWALGRDGRARCGASAAACRLSRYAGGAGPGGSTRPRPESLRPSRDAPTPVPSGDQPLFFRAECRSGLVIQCLARFPLVCRRFNARRMVSSLIHRSVTPCSWQTCAARASVHTPVDLP